MPHFKFDEKKATQVAAHLLHKSDGRMKYLLMMKMLYTIDRIALANWGQPVIGGQYSALPKGPVISEALDLIRERAAGAYWSKHLRTKGYDLELKSPTGVDELSQAEVDLIETVFVMLAHRSQWDVVKWTHNEFKEWKNPGRSSLPITLEALLKAVGKTEDEIEKISQEATYQNSLQSILGH